MSGSNGSGEAPGSDPDRAGSPLANPYRSYDDPSAPHASEPPPAPPRAGFRWVAVLAGVAIDIGVLFGVVLILTVTLLVRAGLAADPERIFADALGRPEVLTMLFAGLFLGHAGGGFVSGRIAGGRPGWHGLAVAIGFTLTATLLALGSEDHAAAPVPAWLNGFELLARAPLTILGCHAGVARSRLRRS